MVNGLAPPGTTSLEDMEGWGCARCGTWNGSPPGQRRSAKSEGGTRRLTIDILDDGKAKGRRATRSPSPNPENARTTRSKAKKEQELHSSSDEEDDTLEREVKLEGGSSDEEILEASQPKTKGGKVSQKA